MSKKFDTNDTNLKALFLGDKGENADVMKSLMNKLNHDFYDYASFGQCGLCDNEFVTSHTDKLTLAYEDYEID